MSLNWNLQKIKNWQKLCYMPDPQDAGETILNPVTYVIIMSSISLDLDSITESNVWEWYKRLRYLEETQQFYLLSVGKKKRNPTLKELKAHIGLSVNVTSVPKFKTWATRKAKNRVLSLEYMLNSEINKLKENEDNSK
jgi:hypothetical protein